MVQWHIVEYTHPSRIGKLQYIECMNYEKAKKLAERYVEGWKDNNLEKILEPLVEDCTIIESHGPTYRGHGDVRAWVESWIAEGYKVDKWNITSFLFADDSAVFEWHFEFSGAASPTREIDGVTIVKFKDGKIEYLREYRTTEPLYDWADTQKLNTF